MLGRLKKVQDVDRALMSCLPATGKLLDSKTDDKQEVLWDT